MKKLTDIIYESIVDVCLSNVVENGIFDPHETSHLHSLIERLENVGLDEKTICEAINALTKEGKYPDRQAFNKEGWLVTFPTPEHRAAAIKKRTHFSSDPTHGQGGMNLYYKKKGKQSRQKQQGSSEVGADGEDVQQAKPAGEPDAAPADPAADDQGGELPASGGGDGAAQQSGGQQGGSAPSSGGEGGSLPAADNSGGADAADSGEGAEKAAGAGDQPPASGDATAQAPKTPDYVEISKRFALEKKWTSTPYGDWNDVKGQLAAVTALDDQVVPIRFTDREELKSRVAKQEPSV